MKTIKQVCVLLMSILICSNSVSGQGMYEAVKNGELTIVKKLLENNPDLINTQDRNGDAPLHYAAILDKPDIANYLLSKGAHVNLKGNYGRTPLHYTASFGNYNTCVVLIENGADLNIKNEEGRPPLDYAVHFKKSDIVEELISHNANVDTEGDYGRSLFHRAAIGGYRKIVELMMNKGIDIKTKNDNGGNLLHSITSGGIHELAESAIKKGIKVNAKNRYGLTPLHIASSHGHEKLVESLIANDANINIKSTKGKSALHFSKENDHINIVKILEDNGIDTEPSKFPLMKGDYLGLEKPGLTPILFAPGIVSTSGNEHCVPVFHPNMKEVYWSMNIPGSEVIYYMKEENGYWSQPQIASFSGQYHDGGPFLSFDGNILYFYSKRPLEENDTSKDLDFWAAEREGNGWGEPKNLGPVINSEYWDSWGSVAKNGNIYYTYNSDIYLSRFNNDQYTKPEKLGDSVNTDFMERGTWIAPDESYLIFSSSKPGGFGSGDLFIVFRKSDGSWTNAENMGNEINSSKVDMVCSISPDGKYLFIRSWRNGNGDIFWVDAKVIENLRPESLKQ